ncbi:MAG: S-layer homology domain-containing protein [Acidobacteriota bacterium]
MRISRERWAWIALLTLAPAAIKAQAPPLSGEFLANTYTTNSQSVPAIASDGHGKFVVVWDDSGKDGYLDGVFGQRFDAAGSKLGAEFPVNTYTTNSQFNARVAMNGSGAFVVVWESASQDGSSSGVFGQRFDASGAKVGAEFQVNTHTSGVQNAPAVAMGDAGEFVVVWQSQLQDGSGYGVFGQRFGSSGSKSGSEFQVNTYTTGDQAQPAVAMDGGGNFAVVWASTNQDGSGQGVFGQRYDAAGTPHGAEFAVNTYTTLDQNFPDVAMDRRGDFVVVWNSHGQDESSYAVSHQLFNSGGERVGSENTVNDYTTGAQSGPSVAMAPDGSFVVTWQSYLQDGSSWGIFGRRYDRIGQLYGAEFPLNAYTTSAQDAARVVHDGAGFTAVWESEQDGSGLGIIGRRQNVLPEGLTVDAHGIGITDLNGVMEPGEAVVVEPEWGNRSAANLGPVDGNATQFYGPAGPTYTLLDATAGYGNVLGNTLAGCYDATPNACYAVQVGSVPRPGTHWDAVLPENLSIGGTHYWILHVGDSFSDVPRSHPFYKRIEALLHNGITSGCTTTQYCPGAPVPRDQMAIFIAKGIAGGAPLIPSSGTVAGQPYNCKSGGVSLFSDVSPTDSSCKHVHYLAVQNVTLGCGATTYCPGQTVTRDAMASFIAKAIVAPQGGAGVPAAYTDPGTGRSYSCNAGSPNLHFTDVPVTNAFCKHIHFLWAKDIVAGCSATQYCPGLPVTRDAMAKFLGNAFNLKLYGP